MARERQRTLTPTDYTIACICPMGVELAPVEGMLDEIHESLPTSRDLNAYTLGKIGGHNVVVAVMPEIGNSAATAAAMQLLNDFPSIRFGLLVGIGGGVPGDEENNDIRLGDVVVSKPTDTFGGVVQYDRIKRLVNGQIERTGQLNKPPAVLRATVQKLQARHLRAGTQIPMYLATMTQRWPKMRARYSFPAREQDLLFLPSYPHQSGATCDQCDVRQTVSRDARLDNDPNVHYGTIGSANVVVKDPAVRDTLKRDMDILCVEMEAAGLMDTFPCLVIRGICDYADSHKNKRWQPYAAAVAAAYMKELLMVIPAQDVLQLMRVEEIIVKDTKTHKLLDRSIQLQEQTISHRHQEADKLEMQYQTDQERKCHQSFACIYEQYKDVNSDRMPGTCKWVLDHHQFRAWQQTSHNNLLWISADPGCGKSVFSKSLVDREFKDPNQSTVCYFFFKDNELQDNLNVALKALLHQLFSHQPQLLRYAMSVWEKKGDMAPYEVNEMWRVFLAATADSTAKLTICVLDALDECREDNRRTLITLLCDFYRQSCTTTSEGVLKFLVTSRPYDSVQRWFEQITSELPQIRLRGERENDNIHEEINLVINQRVNELATNLSLSDRNREWLRQRLHQMEHRTYLWLHLATEEIRETYQNSLDPDEVKIDSLPTSVDNAYERILQKVDPRQKPNAQKVLLIILGARRPLTIGEMALALGAIRARESNSLSIRGLNKERLEEQIRQWCGLFVFINHSKIFLIHQTAKEFLLADNSHISIKTGGWKWSFVMAQVENEMASLCIQYLYLNSFNRESDGKSRQCGNGASDELYEIQSPIRVDRKGFFEYSAEHWASHLNDQALLENKNLLETENLLSKVCSLYDTRSKLFSSWFPFMWRSLMPYEEIPKVLSQHVVAFSGHAVVLDQLYKTRGFEIEAQDDSTRTALIWAAERGNEAVVRWLLDAGAEVNAQGGWYGNALQAASKSGHEKVVQMLLNAGAEVNAQGGDYGNALQGASKGGHEKVVQMLLNAGAEVNSRGGLYSNALHAASHYGHKKVVQMLLSARAEVNTQGGDCSNALQGASRGGHEKVVQMLLSAGAKVNAPGGDYGNALQAASHRGHEKVVQILLSAGGEINNQGGHYGNALQGASEGGHEKVVQILLNAGAEVNSQGGLYSNALQAASRFGHEKVVQMLLNAGAEVNAQGRGYSNALQVASEGGHEKVVQILLNARAEVNAQGGVFGNALQGASRGGHEKVVQMLLNAGAEVNAQGGYYGNALQVASRFGHEKVVQVLLATGAKRDESSNIFMSK